MNNEIKISIRAYAKQLGVDESSVRKAVGNKGSGKKILKGFDKKTKKIIPSIADAEWGFIHKNPKPQRGLSKQRVVEKLKSKNNKEHISASSDSNDDTVDLEKNYTYSELIEKINIHPLLSYSDAILTKEILGAALDKMKLEELQGLLVRKLDIDKALYAVGVELKKALLNIPARCINDIRAASTDIEATNILNVELQLALTHLPSELKKNK